MKIRQGFVSNSSSSSFVCDICGDVQSGYDVSLSDFYMTECEDGHVMHFDCIDKELSDDCYITDRWNDKILKKEHCPICNLIDIDDKMLLNYILTRYKSVIGKRENIREEIRKNFKNMEEFISWQNQE